MLYKITAKFNPDNTNEFFTKIQEGTTSLKAMKEAIITDHHTISWYETCFDASPIKYREKLYENYLYDFQEMKTDKKEPMEGKSFWKYLKTIHTI